MCIVGESMRFVCFKQKTAYEMRISDWSSDVCSSDLTCLRAYHYYVDADHHHAHDSLSAVDQVSALPGDPFLPALPGYRVAFLLSQHPEVCRWRLVYGPRRIAIGFGHVVLVQSP